MKLTDTMRESLDKGEFDAVEAEWLVRADEEPSDLPFFVTAANGLAGASEEARAVALLELLDEQLRERDMWETRLELIREAGKLYLRSGRVHGTVLETLREAYSDRSDELEAALSAVGLDRAKDATTKLWDRVERLRNLLAFEVGTIVAMKDKGVGTVTEVNLALQTLKIDFERHPGLAVGLRAAGKLLEILPDGHLLRRKVEAPEELVALRDQDPPQLLRAVLESYGRPLSASEIREALAGVVDAKQWTAFWSAARKHPQVVSSGGSRQAYEWARTAAAAEDALWQSFVEADPRRKLDYLKRASDEQRVRMAEVLAELAERARRDNDAALAFEIRAALDRSPGATVEWTVADLVAELRDPRALIENLPTRTLREQAYAAVRSERADWLEVFDSAFLVEEDQRALDTLAGALGESDAERFERLVDQVLAQTSRAPAAFVWLAERAAEDEALRERRSARLARQILRALGEEALAPYRARLQALFDSGSTMPRILSHLTAEEAADIEAAITGASRLEQYRRQPLINALHLRFPELRKPQDQPLHTTASSLEAKRNELRTLLEEEIPKNRRAIEEARALGDLRENFEYKSARQRHEYLNARAAALDRDLHRVQVLDPGKVDTSSIRVGTRSELRGTDGSRRQITVLGPWESEPERGVVSYESELAQLLLGKRVGETVVIDDRSWEIDSIAPFE
jgi:transcription elongation GreA/GreB family factor